MPPLRALLLAFALPLLAACQTGDVSQNDAEYNCGRIRGYEPGTQAYRDCLYDESLARRYRYP